MIKPQINSEGIGEKMETTKQSEISKELIGRNIIYEILRKPSKKSDRQHPRGFQTRYSDDYLNKLNEFYDLEEVLGDKKEIIESRNISSYFIYKKNIQAAEAIWKILKRSIEAGNWQPFIIDFNFYKSNVGRTAKTELEKIKEKEVLDFGLVTFYNYTLYGLEKARRIDRSVEHIEHDNKIISIPTQSFIEKIARERESFCKGEFYPLA